MSSTYKKLEQDVEKVVDMYECSDCGHVFPEMDIPLYCPGCGEVLS